MTKNFLLKTFAFVAVVFLFFVFFFGVARAQEAMALNSEPIAAHMKRAMNYQPVTKIHLEVAAVMPNHEMVYSHEDKLVAMHGSEMIAMHSDEMVAMHGSEMGQMIG